ncbi:tyrosine-type recombinase/integrase [Streptomyces sp. NPDC018833]|uniref:tyrosine-type recombinase/integrase n=1 Tax=Streptomyces sp. NPDC018833 TaxID=3365053 RepID=UPI00379788AF
MPAVEEDAEHVRVAGFGTVRQNGVGPFACSSTVIDQAAKLHPEARKGPVASSSPTLGQHLAYWLKEVVQPDLKPKTADTLPLPRICVTALKLRQEAQRVAKKSAGQMWQDTDFAFSTRYGTPIEPRNFNRAFAARSAKAGIRKIRLHDTRHTCGSLLAALDMHRRIAMQILRHSKIAV